MKRIFKTLGDHYLNPTLCCIFITVVTVLLCINVWMLVVNIPEGNHTICLKEECIKYFLSTQNYTVSFFMKLMVFISSSITMAGIYVALRSYISTVENNIYNNNDVHFQNFKYFIEVEIKNKDLTILKKLNVFQFYNKIYETSPKSLFSIKTTYLEWVTQLVHEVQSSNKFYLEPNSVKAYNHNNHQSRIISKFNEINIDIPRSTRTGFYESEAILFNFFNVLHKEFCKKEDEKYIIPLRKYDKSKI